MFSERLRSFRRSVAFRLAALYAAIFTATLYLTFFIFYVLVLYGSHGISRHALSAIREDFREYFAWPLLLVILVSTVIGWFMARRALSGLVELTRTASAVAEGTLGKRVPMRGRQDEIDDLAHTFNTMLDRIGSLISGIKETNDNIAHDLRSPVSRMRAMAESALTDAAAPEETRVLAGRIVSECDRLLEMANTMLDISEAEAGLAKLSIEELDLVPIIRDAVELFQPMAEEKQVSLQVEAPAFLSLRTDRRKVQRVVGNLLDNAIKFNRPGGAVSVSVHGLDGQAVIEVADTGIGIAEEDLVRVFDRFFRAEKSRTTPGNGLGLSLARALASSLGGSVSLRSTPGHGSTFTVLLPFQPVVEGILQA